MYLEALLAVRTLILQNVMKKFILNWNIIIK